MQPATASVRDYLLVVLSTLLWASNIALGRLLRDQLSPITLTAGRFFIAGLLFAWLLRNRSGRRPDRSEWLLLAGMAAAGVVGFPILLYFSLRFTTASHAALINAAAPLLTSFLAAAILRERVTLPLILGSSLSLLGVGLVIGGNDLDARVSNQVLIGDFLALITAALWGLYSVIARIVTRNRPSLEATAYSIWLALPVLLPAAVIEMRTTAPVITLPTVLAMLYIGIFPSVIAFLSWNEGVRRLGPNQAMAFYNLLPVFSIFLGFVFLGESLSQLAILGSVMVVAGGLASALPRAKAIRNH